MKKRKRTEPALVVPPPVQVPTSLATATKPGKPQTAKKPSHPHSKAPAGPLHKPPAQSTGGAIPSHGAQLTNGHIRHTLHNGVQLNGHAAHAGLRQNGHSHKTQQAQKGSSSLPPHQNGQTGLQQNGHAVRKQHTKKRAKHDINGTGNGVELARPTQQSDGGVAAVGGAGGLPTGPVGASQAGPKKKKRKTGGSSSVAVIAHSAAGSNWDQLKRAIGAGHGPKKATRNGTGPAGRADASSADAVEQLLQQPRQLRNEGGPTQVMAVDCEMVGVGPEGSRSALARVAVVNYWGVVVYDTYVAVKEKITDYRTRVSGIRPHHLRNAPPLDEVHKKVAELLAGRVLVGHAINNDLQALLLSHPHKDIRDTSRYPPLMSRPPGGGKLKPQALRVLAQQQLGLIIQSGEHSPVDDARAALYLYHKHQKEWEHALRQGGVRRLKGGNRKRQPSFAELAAKDMMADL